ncbi:MAG: glycerol acyltransferase [Bacteroidetes bacterium]|nr:MAG: glycerol acyltransferase [Bacteroidota bacterium]
MIVAKHSRYFEWIFSLYLSSAFKRSFRQIETVGTIDDKGMPFLVIANHISWWDGFWILRLNRNILRRKFHVMMLEDQLQKNMFLRKLGAFSIRKKSKDMIESLNYASGILQNPKSLLLLFPQGEIHSQYDVPLLFQKGWGRMLSKVNNPIQVLMVVHLLDYFSHSKPILKQYVFSPEQTADFSCDELETIYNDFYKQCLENQKALK